MKTSPLTVDLGPSANFRGSLSRREVNSTDQEELSKCVPCHPLGVKPLGNRYTTTGNARNAIGNLQMLPDEIIFILLEYLDSNSLRCLGSTCKAFFAFCYSDDLWKALFVAWPDENNQRFKWRGTWRSTFLCLDSEKTANISCHELFSDVLYRPFLCAHTSLVPYTSTIPCKNAIPHFGDISSEDFQSTLCDKPFILTEPVRQWPVYRTWNTTKLAGDFSEIYFRAESVDWPLRMYVEYMNSNCDESPLYLFDRGFVEKMGLSVGRNNQLASYWIPECFGEDLFATLGCQRPDSRWLIIGPARSGSTFHKDPNATSAWNAVIRGSKYWIMFPTAPDCPPPPGVYVSEDQSEVTSPLSIAEWLLGFHAEARQTKGCLEGICEEGEVLHVPSGWWHLVVNLEPSIAITQNFVPRNHLPSVLSFLKDKPDQVSGFKREVQDPYATFVECLKHQHLDTLAWALNKVGKQAEARKRKWDVAIGNTEEPSFSFEFGGDGDSDDEIP